MRSLVTPVISAQRDQSANTPAPQAPIAQRCLPIRPIAQKASTAQVTVPTFTPSAPMEHTVVKRRDSHRRARPVTSAQVAPTITI